MSAISLVHPRRLLFGLGSLANCAEDIVAHGCRRPLVLTSRSTRRLAAPLIADLSSRGLEVAVDDRVTPEPTVALFETLLRSAREARVDGVIGVGGGSVLDVAKLIAALVDPDAQPLADVIGIGKLTGRRAYLACAPTTAGTGSEASPNAILLDEEKHAKVAVISPWIVPDAAVVDPSLMVSMPPAITATTGLDALAHCIEAYTNKFAHPLIDHYALEGIRLVGAALPRAVANGEDLEARTMMARASWYGGVCLGPVNTAAAHALAYPLGSEFGVAHGMAVALLLASVMDFNLHSAPDRHAEVAIALGVAAGTWVNPSRNADSICVARGGVARVRELVRACGLPSGLGAIGIAEEAVPALARGALGVTRLLKNNPRALTQEDAEGIYRASWTTSEVTA
jgi:alcohol dehydrogenase class IV